jgi:hypothetical protein
MNRLILLEFKLIWVSNGPFQYNTTPIEGARSSEGEVINAQWKFSTRYAGTPFSCSPNTNVHLYS